MSRTACEKGVPEEVQNLEFGDAFGAAGTKAEALLGRIRTISNSEARHGFLCNYLTMLVSLSRRIDGIDNPNRSVRQR